MRILSFTGGAGNMYCGSCLRDNALASEMLRRGHDFVLTPVYTPTRTDETNVSGGQVFFGGISVFLEQHAAIFRHTPRLIDRIWDSSWALRLATKRQIKVDAQSLGEMTVSMLKGEGGYQAKEIDKLLEWLRTEPRFDVINLPYALLLGLAEPLKRALPTPVCVTLGGDDLFLDALGEPYRRQSLDMIRKASVHVDAFLPVSQYYMDFMPGYLGVYASKMRLAPLGITTEDFTPRLRRQDGPFTIGYLARVAPEKGLHALAAAYVSLRKRPGTEGTRLIAAGYLPPEHQGYLDDVRATLRKAGLEDEFSYRGEVDRAQKVSFLHELDVLSVPTTYHEPKGLFVLEAMAAGVPVVQPRHGAFPEMIERTGGGLVVAPDDPEALADGILSLRLDPSLAASLGQAGASGVREHYSVQKMAERVENIYEELASTSNARI
ncbi:MAG TPA: glycosyltransferase family 4 protein, partial [Vicinamibacterales bacterium]|nr:glycosyltransferase family 4 protein [Vicinamibacterales bacterium]